MSAGREELHRILKAVIHDLEIDGYAREQIASAMAAQGIQILFGAPGRPRAG
jgi:predicted O-linked N-acetylglucosamine transferase (SPINDLY family)